METKASMVVMSHLSDAQATISSDKSESNDHINFAKFIILKTNGDLTKEIDPDKLWEEYINR
jgi:hypothetical protein